MGQIWGRIKNKPRNFCGIIVICYASARKKLLTDYWLVVSGLVFVPPGLPLPNFLIARLKRDAAEPMFMSSFFAALPLFRFI